MVASGASLQALVMPVDKCPQTLINVRITRGSADTLMQDAQVIEAVRDVENALGEEGRVLLRPSGTEPLLRVMVEGTDAAAVEDCANRLAESVRQAAAAA
jgi:phosphoglucosamine mutase